MIGSRSNSMRRYQAARREQARVTQLVLRRLPRTIRAGPYPEAIRPFVGDMEREAAAFVQHLGGPENCSEVQLALVRDAAVAGATLAVAFSRIVQTGGTDNEALAKVSGLVSARTRVLQMLGVQRVAKSITLNDYLREREARVGQPPGNPPEKVVQTNDVVSERQPAELVVEPAEVTEDGRYDVSEEPEAPAATPPPEEPWL